MSESVLDLEEFLERVQDDKELLVELLDIFLEDFGEKRKNLGAAVESADAEQVRSIGHSLKGASGNISAKPVREICIKIEEMGINNDFSEGAALLKDLDKAYEELTARIEQIKKDL